MSLDIEPAIINKKSEAIVKMKRDSRVQTCFVLEEFSQRESSILTFLRNSHGLVLFLSQHENQAVARAVFLRRG
jgi:hypothetical protein